MAIPDYQSLLRPILDVLSDGEIRAISVLRDELAERLELSQDDLTQMLPSGKMSAFRNRVYWAKFYLDKADALETVSRGKTRINSRGRELLASDADPITVRHLERYPEFVEWYRAKGAGDTPAVATAVPTREAAPASLSPEEALASSYRELQSALEDELVGEVRQMDPARFEQLVVELLEQLGYGGAGGMGRHLGQSGDDGVDGVIYEDKLGLERIYLQAKRWSNKTVGRPDVQAFAGSLEGQRARKGVFITTSSFSRDARDFVERIEKRIVLIDGEELARLMYDVGLGVTTERTYEVKRIDLDYFSEA